MKRISLSNLINFKRNQLIAACAMTLLGIGVGIGFDSYPSDYDRPQPALPAPKAAEALADSQTASMKETTEAAIQDETEEEIIYMPSVSSLNLAFYYPEGSGQSAGANSYAGEILEKLSYKDSEWLASIYELSSIRPETMAKRLGKAVASVKGLYNSRDEKQDPNKPESWIIHDWSRIDMTFYDENGKPISASSNIKEIMSMANTYFYYRNPEDPQAFWDYTLALWEKSHSYQYSMSDVYYCDGCIEKAETTAENETSKAESAATDSAEPAAASLNLATDSEANSLEEAAQQTDQSMDASQAAETTSETTAEESTVGAPYSVLAAAQNEASQEAAESAPAGEGITEGAANEETPQEITAGEEETKAPLVKCPGHVDLVVHATISGLSSSPKGLYSLDEAGAATDQAWTGWTQENRDAVKLLYNQDWEEAYDLTIFSSYISNPLTAAEISYYIGLLPADTSAERRRVIHYALSSVGKIPYYWGGKPVSSDYVENHFGMLITPDEKGRSMRGLDCSGWINWVYWSAIGLRLPSASTEGLAFCGTGISRDALKPGDIIVRRGANAHVVMFLCWEDGNKMKVIHESGSGRNNVSVGSMEARWPYYRKLID